jgi:hypothetical protein
MPGGSFQRVAAEMREHLTEFINAPFDMVRAQMVFFPRKSSVLLLLIGSIAFLFRRLERPNHHLFLVTLKAKTSSQRSSYRFSSGRQERYMVVVRTL